MENVGRGRPFLCRLVLIFATVCIVLLLQPSAGGQLRPSPTALASVPTGLVDRVEPMRSPTSGWSTDRGPPAMRRLP